MRYRALGARGPTVSVVGVGGNNFGSRLGEDGTKAIVHAALDAGITLFDTADMYGGFGESGGARGDGERLLGAALKGHRDHVVLATKFGMEMGSHGEGAEAGRHGPRGSRRYVRYAVEASLRSLGTDRIDVYQYHEPDGVTPLEETAAALRELADEGKIGHLGCSSLPAEQLSDAFVSTQARYHLLDRGAENDLIPACLRNGVGLLPYYPLANGLLSGKYRRGQAASAREPPVLAAGLAHRRRPRPRRGTHRVRRRTWPDPPPGRGGRARSAARRRLRHLRRHDPRTGHRQRRCGRLAPRRARPGRSRHDRRPRRTRRLNSRASPLS